ncbi:MAG: pectin-derived oligosaccharide transport system permease protein, partial [Pseudonocardiales bacterium]|nr:pectin-derived oligosaccharide transport system permease protein [Pseudonocardiales bacterium]
MSENSGVAVLDPPVPEKAPPPVRRKRKRHKHNLAGYGFLAPWLIGLFAFTLIPMVYSLYLSLTKFNLLTAPQWIGFDNYVRLFSDERYLQSIKVTLLYVVTSVPLKLAAALLVAVALNRGLKALGFYRATFYLPSLLGASVAV